jgi:uncharacterized protein
MTLSLQIAQELSVKPAQVEAAIGLLDEGATVPFIARYRKEVTGGLDDLQLRDLEVRLRYLRELEDRRQSILESIREQQKLTPELERQIAAAPTKTELEDLYLPFKPKRRTKGMIASEAGLLPLAEQLLADPTLDPLTLSLQFIDAEKGVPDSKAALEGAKYILMERFAEDPALAGKLRLFLWTSAAALSKKGVRRQRNSVTTSTTTNLLQKCPRIARWRFFAGATKASCRSASECRACRKINAIPANP